MSGGTHLVGYPLDVRCRTTIRTPARVNALSRVAALAVGLAACGAPVLDSSTERVEPTDTVRLPSAAPTSLVVVPSLGAEIPSASASAPEPASEPGTRNSAVAPDTFASSLTGVVLPIAPLFSRPSLSGPVDRVVFVGDSLMFDGRSVAGGRPNDVVPHISDHIESVADLAGTRIVNRSIPGLATLYAIDPDVSHGRDTLAEQLPHALRGQGRDSVLLVIPVSSSDLIVTEDRRRDDVIDEVITELERLRDELVADSQQVVFVPARGVNDAMYDDIRNGLKSNRREHHLNARIERLNQRLLRSSLPMLVADLAGLGSHGPEGAESRYFVGYDDRPDPWPDDGIHPNQEGERLYASVVGSALVELLTAAVEVER